MPLKRCVNAEGKKGYSWGNGGCQVAGSDLESKKQAIRVGLKVEGPGRFKKIMEHDKGQFIDQEGLNTAKAIYKEAYPNGVISEFMSSIASYFAAKADDGDNDSDVNKETPYLDKSGHPFSKDMTNNSQKNKEEIHPGGEWGMNPQKTGDGSSNEFNKKGIAASENHCYNDVTDKLQEDKAGIVETGGGGNSTDFTMADMADNNDASLDKDRKQEGLITIPPYNHDASPESDPDKKVPDTEPPTREDMTAKSAELADLLLYSLDNSAAKEYDKEEEEDKACMANLYSGNQEDAEDYARAYISKEERDKMPKEDFADPEHEGFPIKDKKHYELALRLVGRKPESEQSRIRENIKKIGERKGFTSDKSEGDSVDFHENAIPLNKTLT